MRVRKQLERESLTARIDMETPQLVFGAAGAWTEHHQRDVRIRLSRHARVARPEAGQALHRRSARLLRMARQGKGEAAVLYQEERWQTHGVW